MSLVPAGLDYAALIAQSLHVAVVSMLFTVGKGVYAQAFTRLGQSLGRGRGIYFASLEKLHPLVKRCARHLVKIVDAQHVIFGEDVACILANEYLTLANGQLQDVVLIVQAAKLRLAVVNIVLSLAEVEVHYVDRVHLANLVIVVTKVDILRYGLRHAVEHTVEVIKLTVVLHLDD